jgi:biotin carboxylase
MNAGMQNNLLIVDGYSSGNLLPTGARARGFAPVHVQSTQVISPYVVSSYRPKDYVDHLIYGGNAHNIDGSELNRFASELSSLNPAAVIAGSESGVILATYLSERLGLRGNRSDLSHIWRNKLLIARRLQEVGIPTARFFGATNPDEILSWMKRESIRKPVFLKPLTECGGVNVRGCKTESEIRRVFGVIYGQKNHFGITDSHVLCQEYMDGREYVLDTVSGGGYHVVTGVWKYGEKFMRGGAAVYNYDELLVCQGAVQERLIAYAFGVLDALGIQYGPAHMEIKDTRRGARLVDFAARFVGVRVPKIEKRGTGRDAIALTIDAFTRPGKLRSLKPVYGRLLKHALLVSLVTQMPGARMSYRQLGKVESLPGYFQHSFRDEGAFLSETVDQSTAPGSVWLLHEDPEIIMASMATIREWEAAGLFEENL